MLPDTAAAQTRAVKLRNVGRVVVDKRKRRAMQFTTAQSTEDYLNKPGTHVLCQMVFFEILLAISQHLIGLINVIKPLLSSALRSKTVSKLGEFCL